MTNKEIMSALQHIARKCQSLYRSDGCDCKFYDDDTGRCFLGGPIVWPISRMKKVIR